MFDSLIGKWNIALGVDERSIAESEREIDAIKHRFGNQLEGVFSGFGTGATLAAGAAGAAFIGLTATLGVARAAANKLGDVIGGIASRDKQLQVEMKAAREEWHALLGDVADPALQVARDAFKDIARFLKDTDRSAMQDATAELVAMLKIGVELTKEMAGHAQEYKNAIAASYRFTATGQAIGAAGTAFDYLTGGLSSQVRTGIQLDRKIKAGQQQRKEAETTREAFDFFGRQLDDAGDMAKNFAENARRGAVKLGWEAYWGANRFAGDLAKRKAEKIAEQREINANFAAKWREAIGDQVANRRNKLADDAMAMLENRPRHQFAGLTEMWKSIQAGIRGGVTDADIKAAIDAATEQQKKSDDNRDAILKEIKNRVGVAKAAP